MWKMIVFMIYIDLKYFRTYLLYILRIPFNDKIGLIYLADNLFPEEERPYCGQRNAVVIFTNNIRFQIQGHDIHIVTILTTR